MLELHNISKSFANLEVLKDISLSIQKGEIISILGQSGSGKSTLLNIIAGFEEADTGEGVYNQHTIFSPHHFCEPQERHIGFVFQDYALFPHLTIAQNISFGIQDSSKQEQKNKVTELLELMGLEGIEKKYPHQISGGQQQRVSIARVLARDSELILFDEVFSSIDSTLKATLLMEIKEILQSQNKTAIFVSHCPRESILLSDKICYLEEGKVIQFDTPSAFRNNPVSDSVRAIFGDESFLFSKVEDLLAR